MISYNNSNIVQCLRQYDMFANSLNLVKTREEKDMIIKQLTKLEIKIIDLTNEIYEEEYYELANKECGLIEEELNRLNMLIDLINQRLSYVEKRCNSHYQLTGESIDVKDVLGANTLDSLEDRIKIIDKYSKNIKLEKELTIEVESLTNKITLASEKIDINKSLNEELEKKFRDLLSESFEKLGYYELFDNREEIEYAYYETEKLLTLAELNLETAKTSPLNILNECQEMLSEVKKDYNKYKEKLSILKLMESFNKEANDYEELLNKRKEINELLRYIKDDKFLSMVTDTITKQYNTILMEQQDINTYNDLLDEKSRKIEVLTEIAAENNSERFQVVLEELIRNEKARQAKILEEQKRIEEEENKRKLEIERKKREEILKRQKIIEDARKKEMEKRTKQLLEQQQKSILKDKGNNFENIKDILTVEEPENIKEIKSKETSFEENYQEEIKDEPIIFKNKIDIEKELFEEFNNNNETNNKIDNNIEITENIEDKKLPDISIDEYMKNFNENEFEENEINTLFKEDDIFPNIPL